MKAEKINKNIDLAARMARQGLTLHEQGDCETCGDWSSQLAFGMCPTCKYKYIRESPLNIAHP